MATSLATTSPNKNLSAAFAEKYGVEVGKVFGLLKDTVLKSKDPVADAEVAAFMIVANQYDLNPFVKEIYGFMSKGKMQYVVSVDGWSTLINRQTMLDGVEFEPEWYIDAGTTEKKLFSMTCKIYRKDRSHPICVTEYMKECYRPPMNGSDGPWQSHPNRMLRHKSLIQCARLAFGFAGVMDEDEAERMPGFVGLTIESSQPKKDAEAESLMERMGWPEAKRGLARRQYKEDVEGLRAALQKEMAKSGIATAKEVQEEPTASATDDAPNDPEPSAQDDFDAKPKAEPAKKKPSSFNDF